MIIVVLSGNDRDLKASKMLKAPSGSDHWPQPPGLVSEPHMLLSRAG